MKKALAILLVLLMVCSTVVAMIPAHATEEPTDWEAVTDAYGANIYIGGEIETAPVLDGVIGDGEYSFSKVNSADDIYNYASGEVQSEITEYFAHDAANVYYAVEFVQAADNRAFQWQFNPFNSFDIFNGNEDMTAYYYTRVSWQARYQTMWHHPLHPNTDYSGSWAPTINGNCVRTPVIFTALDAEALVAGTVSEELECASNKNAETNVKVYEVRLSKAYIAEVSGCEVADVRVVPYFTYFHSAAGLGHVYTEADIAALTAAGAAFLPENGAGELGYNFIVLDSKPVEINVEDMPGYKPFYAGAPIATAPVQDGVINAGEYSASRELKPYTANKGEVDLEAYTNVTTEYVAYDADYIYYAYTNAMQYSAGAQLKLRLVHDYVIGETLKTFQAHRQLEADEAIQLTLGTGAANSASEIPEGKAAPTADEFVTFLSHSGTSYTPAVVEMKISRAYLAAQMGLENASDVTKFTYSTYATDTVFYEGGDWTYVHLDHLLTADQMAWLTAQGVTTPLGGSTAGDQVSRLFNMIVLGEEPDAYKALLDEMGLTTYVPFATTAPTLDGVVNDGEYTYTKTWAPEEIYNYGTEIQSGVTESIAHDANYIYYAVEFTQEANNRALQWQFQPTNTLRVFNGKGAETNEEMKVTLFQRITWQLRYQDDGTTTVHEAPKFNYTITDAAPQVGAGLDLEYAAAKTAENVKTYEIKLAKAYIANYSGCEVADVNVLPYFTYFHSACALGHNYTTEETEAIKALGATRADTGLLYRFLILEDAPEVEAPAIDSLDDLYAPTYVGAPLAADAAKPVADSYIRAGEYQVAYVVPATYNGHAARMGVAANLLGDFTTYVAHDADYFYVAFEFYNGDTAGRGRLYWNLSFIDSFNITYGGGSDINTAFLNNGYGIVDGWNFGAEVKADLSEGFSGRNNAVTRGTAPVQGEDFDVAIWKEDLGAEVSATTHQVYEFKVSKAWYAAQVGLESAADVRELAWTNQGAYINEHASSYTQIGHHLTEEDLAALAAAGFNYTVPGTASHPYDNSMLPLLFVLDADPNGDDATMVPAEDVNRPVEPVDPPVTDGPTTEGSATQPSTQPSTTAPATTTEAPATTTAKATTKAATTAAATTAAETEADGKGCKGSIAISALVLVPTLAGGALLLKRRKED